MKLSIGVIPVVLALLAGSSTALYSAERAPAADFPTKPIRWIVPFPPGGSNDVLGRYIGIKLTERVGQQIIIDNRAGANGIIGAQMNRKFKRPFHYPRLYRQPGTRSIARCLMKISPARVDSSCPASARAG